MKKILIVFSGIFILIIALGIPFPAGNDIIPAKKTQAKNDELQLAVSIKEFYTEYGYYPTLSNEAIRADKTLLSILTGTETPFNYRKIVFIETSPAKKKAGRWVGGIDPDTGSWVDPWGNPYWVKIDADYDGIVYNPYDSGAGEKKLHSQVIVWSPGQDGIFGNPAKPGDYQGSKDILSWQ